MAPLGDEAHLVQMLIRDGTSHYFQVLAATQVITPALDYLLMGIILSQAFSWQREAVMCEDPSQFIYVATLPIFLAWFCTIVFLYWTITALNIVALIRLRSGFLHSDKMVSRLILFTAETQLGPSIFALGFLVLHIVDPTSPGANFFSCGPKIWIITCLQVIGARQSIRQQIETERERRQNTFDLGLEETILASNPTENITSFLAASRSGQFDSQSVALEGSTLKRWDDENLTPVLPDLEVAYLNVMVQVEPSDSKAGEDQKPPF
ncbi:MAG: hypothetical protein TREMPRED_005019 [Tremellales sp. Tagirdzhanova-0007]|nr:MAG: hypothetical protein TREMPRED_005019 [Tremellales sp. Tagirdzhanova-0007]